MIRLLHVITSSSTGGAEHMLARLAGRLRSEFTQKVISLAPLGPVAELIARSNIDVESVNLNPRAPNPIALMRLHARIRAFRPDVVQTWMYHADLLGGLAARAAGVKAIAWNIRNNTLSPQTTSRTTRLVVAACAKLSASVPNRIVCCAKSAIRTHVLLGYREEKMRYIPNGFDLTRFRPDPSSRDAVRAELNLEPETPLIGLIGRFDPQKNHEGFIRAARMIRDQRSDVHFLLAGCGIDGFNRTLADWITEERLNGAIHLLGERVDIPRLNQSLDIAVSSSYGEAFPNVLGEAMACGVAIVCTDAGDAADIVGPVGQVVRNGDMAGLANACLSLLDMPKGQRDALGTAAARRITEHFDIERTADRYAALYRDMLQG